MANTSKRAGEWPGSYEEFGRILTSVAAARFVISTLKWESASFCKLSRLPSVEIPWNLPNQVCYSFSNPPLRDGESSEAAKAETETSSSSTDGANEQKLLRITYACSWPFAKTLCLGSDYKFMCKSATPQPGSVLVLGAGGCQLWAAYAKPSRA